MKKTVRFIIIILVLVLGSMFLFSCTDKGTGQLVIYRVSTDIYAPKLVIETDNADFVNPLTEGVPDFTFQLREIKDMPKDYTIFYNEGHTHIGENEVILSKWDYISYQMSLLGEIKLDEKTINTIITDEDYMEKLIFLDDSTYLSKYVAKKLDKDNLSEEDDFTFTWNKEYRDHYKEPLLAASLIKYNVVKLTDLSYEDEFIKISKEIYRIKENGYIDEDNLEQIEKVKFNIIGYYESDYDRKLSNGVKADNLEAEKIISYLGEERTMYGKNDFMGKENIKTK